MALATIPTRRFEADSVTSAKLDEKVIQYAAVAITNAQIKAMRATPVTLVAAPGANKLVVVHSVVLLLDYGSEVLTESTDNMVIQYNDGQDISAAIEATGFIDASADTFVVVYPANIAGVASASVGVNQAVELFNTGDGEYGGNASDDTTMDAYVTYTVLDVST